MKSYHPQKPCVTRHTATAGDRLFTIDARPMFKRLVKRQRREEQADALGLDEHDRQELGLHTDSSESESDSSSGSEAGPRRTVAEEQDDASSAGSASDDDSDGDSLEEEPDEPTITTEQALDNPIYAVSSTGLQACIICPGKELKQPNIVKMHLESTVGSMALLI